MNFSQKKTSTSNFTFILFVSLLLACQGETIESKSAKSNKEISRPINLLKDIVPLASDSIVNAVIEIPAGSIQKWEINKRNGQLEWELENGKPRLINYIGYPGNYGFIPQTYLPKDLGGDGDPLDIIVLGPSAERGEVLKCKLLGVLYLLDRGEEDDKLIAVSEDSPLFTIQSFSELEVNYPGVLEIISTWFSNYKGKGKMEVTGIGNEKEAMLVLKKAIEAYRATNAN
jgi:inorganic pyrophosphatase